MRISNHKIEGAKAITTLGTGSPIRPTRLVIHYTAGSTLSGAVSTLKKRRLSYNVLIDTDGSIHQARGLNRRSSHAGRSNWKEGSGLKNTSSLNASSIGISLVNLGMHDYFKGGYWWYGRDRDGRLSGPKVKDEDANKLASKYAPRDDKHWAPYTDKQKTACHQLIAALVREYQDISEIVGHDDVAINAKFDPGPDLAIDEWREEFGMKGPLGFKTTVDSPDGELNVRDRPQYLGGRKELVIRQNDVVHIRSFTYTRGSASVALVNSSNRALTGWASVDIDGSNKHAGFVYTGYLSSTPLRPEYARNLLSGGS